MSWLGLLFSFALAENVVFVRQFAPFPGCGAGLRRPVAGALATALLLAAAALAGWAARVHLLEPLGLAALLAPVLALLVAALAALGRLLVRAVAPAAEDPFGPALEPSAGRCAVLGVVIALARAGYGPLEALAAGAAAGLGYLLAVAVLSGVGERLEAEETPAPLRGRPLALVTAGLVALAFTAFDRALLAPLTGP